MEEQKGKRVLNIELDNDVKKVSITGKNGDEKVVMRQELNEDDLDMVTGGNEVSIFLQKRAGLHYAPANPSYGPLNICDKKG